VIEGRLERVQHAREVLCAGTGHGSWEKLSGVRACGARADATGVAPRPPVTPGAIAVPSAGFTIPSIGDAIARRLLTDDGHRLLERAFGLAVDHERDLCADLSVDEREQLLEPLGRMGLRVRIPPGTHSALGTRRSPTSDDQASAPVTPAWRRSARLSESRSPAPSSSGRHHRTSEVSSPSGRGTPSRTRASKTVDT
jgi:hypothetical protein